MEDYYYDWRGGDGSRIGAHGADDNDSATATLLQSAPIFLKLAKEGKLERDVWLIHLTGEEFPSDCMGARVFCQALIEKTLKLHTTDDDRWIDLSQTKVVGVLVMDMIGHNRDNARNTFQISPGRSEASLRLAYEARRHVARGDAGLYATTLTASGDVTSMLVNPTQSPNLYQHADLFLADGAAEVIWRPILDWLLAHQ